MEIGSIELSKGKITLTRVSYRLVDSFLVQHIYKAGSVPVHIQAVISHIGKHGRVTVYASPYAALRPLQVHVNKNTARLPWNVAASDKTHHFTVAARHLLNVRGMAAASVCLYTVQGKVGVDESLVAHLNQKRL